MHEGSGAEEEREDKRKGNAVTMVTRYARVRVRRGGEDGKRAGGGHDTTTIPHHNDKTTYDKRRTHTKKIIEYTKNNANVTMGTVRSRNRARGCEAGRG